MLNNSSRTKKFYTQINFGRVAGLLLLLSILIATIAYAPVDDIKGWGWDVAVFRAGSKALLQVQNPYDPSNILQYADGAELATIPHFIYAPFFAVLIGPLTF
jgi:hypothetical protein